MNSVQETGSVRVIHQGEGTVGPLGALGRLKFDCSITFTSCGWNYTRDWSSVNEYTPSFSEVWC